MSQPRMVTKVTILGFLLSKHAEFSLCRPSGGAKGIRTPDLLIANETLYQLSYSPNVLLFKVLQG